MLLNKSVESMNNSKKSSTRKDIIKKYRQKICLGSPSTSTANNKSCYSKSTWIHQTVFDTFKMLIPYWTKKGSLGQYCRTPFWVTNALFFSCDLKTDSPDVHHKCLSCKGFEMQLVFQIFPLPSNLALFFPTLF